MEGTFDLSFCELRCKEVINTADGRRLGRVVDVVFSACGEVRGIVVPFYRRVFFTRSQEVFIPWKCIDCIGEDVILVCLMEEGFFNHPGKGGRFGHGSREYRPPEKGGGHGGGRGHDGGGRGHDGGKGQDCDRGHDGGKGHEGGRGGVFIRTHAAGGGNAGYGDEDGEVRAETQSARRDGCEPPHEGPRCDRKCEKCMLFDCAYRWKS